MYIIILDHVIFHSLTGYIYIIYYYAHYTSMVHFTSVKSMNVTEIITKHDTNKYDKVIDLTKLTVIPTTNQDKNY